MAFTLDKVVPWGRSYEEYAAMFALTERELRGRFLGCGDGPAGFNAVLTRRGGSVVSVDPLYQFSADEIRRRIAETSQEVLEQTRRNRHEFVWRSISSVEELGRVRLAAMEEFLADFPAGLKAGRYVVGSLPELPFKDGAFDIALCSHFLFLYSAHLPLEFHVESVKELCRVAGEARIFPILELGAARSRHVDQVIARLNEEGYEAALQAVQYEFQRGGNEMLRVARRDEITRLTRCR